MTGDALLGNVGLCEASDESTEAKANLDISKRQCFVHLLKYCLLLSLNGVSNLGMEPHGHGVHDRQRSDCLLWRSCLYHAAGSGHLVPSLMSAVLMLLSGGLVQTTLIIRVAISNPMVTKTFVVQKLEETPHLPHNEETIEMWLRVMV